MTFLIYTKITVPLVCGMKKCSEWFLPTFSVRHPVPSHHTQRVTQPQVIWLNECNHCRNHSKLTTLWTNSITKIKAISFSLCLCLKIINT